MWGPSSDTQDRLIEKFRGEVMMMSEIASAVMDPFWSAEMDYRRERARELYAGRSIGAKARGRRRWLPRRPTLKLPQQRRRPVAVA